MTTNTPLIKTPKSFMLALMATMLLGLGMTVASCSDDDNSQSEQRNDLTITKR